MSSSTKLLREQIGLAIDGNKIMEMLDKIDSPTEYINAISKLLKLKIITISTTVNKKTSEKQRFIYLFGGLDGTRTRDPMRDRHVF